MSFWCLETLIDPVKPSDFFGDYFEQQRLLVKRDVPGYFGDLISVADIDRILTRNDLNRQQARIADASRTIEASSYVDEHGTVDPNQLLRLHDEGGTIVLNHLHKSHPPLAELCASLEPEFGGRFQSNIYLTPGNAQGFRPHFDTHDVFVLQVEGSKKWRLYDTLIELPIKAHSGQTQQDNPGDVRETFEMHAGDTLYVPRGIVHDAVSTDEDSLHITVGVLTWTWIDLLTEAVDHLAATDSKARASLPRDFVNENWDREGFDVAFKALVEGLSKGIESDIIRRRFAERFIDERSPAPSNRLTALRRLSEVEIDTIIGCRSHMAWLIDEEDGRLIVRFHRGEMKLPLHTESAVRHALQTQRFRVGDLAGPLDDAGKVVLVRRLLKEGLLEFVD
ncbi:MAG: cupin domain-containing protein [Pseudomonadota bacterium]